MAGLNKDFVTLRQLCRQLKVGRAVLERLLFEGKLPEPERLGMTRLFRREDIESIRAIVDREARWRS